MFTLARRLVVILCIAAILYVALTGTPYGELLAILAPLWFFFGLLLSVFPRGAALASAKPQRFSLLPILAPRPPPVG